MNTKTGKALKGVRPDVMKAFLAYGWPGNIRELRSALEYASVVTESGLIQKEDLPASFLRGDERRALEMNRPAVKRDLSELDEKTALLKALNLTQGNRTEAARLLGVHRMTVWNRMKKYGICITNRFYE